MKIKMYNVFEFMKSIRIIRVFNDTQKNKQIHIQYNYQIPSKKEPCEIDKPVPRKTIYY